MEKSKIHSEGIAPFDINLKYVEIDSVSPENVHDHHVHNTCEIYVNLSGNVSFMVENTLYPISPGSVIITRPYEYHHCIYHSNEMHRHYWMLFSCDEKSSLFDIFYNREKGEKNLLLPKENETERLISLFSLLLGDKSDELSRLYSFLGIMDILRNSKTESGKNESYPAPLDFSVRYINSNLSSELDIKHLSSLSFVSVNTLERLFKKHIGVSPSEYIRQKRLAHSAMLLSHGESVSASAEKSGFSDYSNFIYLFRKTYGKTPLRYKKENGVK